ncbi:MAG: gamma carbonic anhydrase family protein [Chloroflexi bacterium]|nr:gamma carbonic anhydrase family protein [Chloroflexota bacterium]
MNTNGLSPSVRVGAEVWIAPGAVVDGDVALSDRANIWFAAVVRSNGAPVVLHEGANVQDNCVVESQPGHPAILGRYATMGHNARVLGAIIEERVLIAMGATVRAGARVGTGSIIGAQAEVPEGTDIPPRSLVVGNGRILRPTTDAEVARIHLGGSEYERLSREYRAAVGGQA